MTRRPRTQSWNLGYLDGRRWRHSNLSHDFLIVTISVGWNSQLAILAIVGAGVVVTTQLAGAVSVFTIFTFKLIVIVQLITIFRSNTWRDRLLGSRRNCGLLQCWRVNLFIRIALDFSRRIILTLLGHFAFAAVLGARLLTFRSWREEALTFLKRGKKTLRFLLEVDVRESYAKSFFVQVCVMRFKVSRVTLGRLFHQNLEGLFVIASNFRETCNRMECCEIQCRNSFDVIAITLWW